MKIKLKSKDQIKVASADDIFGIMKKILRRENKIDRNREHFWTISLDNANKILNIELISLGSIKQTVVEPMEVLSVPLQKRAVRIILVHNHPSQQLTPSAADKDITNRLIQCGLIMLVPVMDHMIISENSYYSFEATGLLKELEASTKYVPTFVLKERWEKQMQQIVAKKQREKDKIKKKLKQVVVKTKKEKDKFEKQLKEAESKIKKAEESKAKDMAKTMKAEGYAIEEIVKLTGLSKQAIQRIPK